MELIAFEITGKVLIAFGAVLAGAGSVLSGIASLRKCGEEKKSEAS